MRLWKSGPASELALGQEVRLDTSGAVGIVGKKLGEGGQGFVYLCDVGGRQLALKWYKPNVVQVDATLRGRITRLITEGAPDKRFLFPVDLASIEGRDEFGYVMQVVSPDRKQFDQVIGQLSLETRAGVCYEIAEAFQALHTSGLCYQDINFGGFFIDPIRGGVLICDGDNITVEGLLGGVLGTPRFMAPEVVRRDAYPSSRTDLYSMAVLFFLALFQTHPLEGKRYAATAARTAETNRQLYGENPIFMFDPGDVSNAPVPGAHDWVVARWSAMPAGLRTLFTRSFTQGLHDPEARVLETEWRTALARLRDAITPCPACNFEIPLDPAATDEGVPDCPLCRSPVPRPIRMNLGRYLVSMLPSRQVLAHHVDGGVPVTLRNAVGAVDTHPTDTQRIGLRNLSQATWESRTTDGRAVPVVPGRTVRIVDGLGIDFGRREGRVKAADESGTGGDGSTSQGLG